VIDAGERELDRGVGWDGLAGIAEDAHAEVALARLVAKVARQDQRSSRS
jgi:hypothetical protein